MRHWYKLPAAESQAHFTDSVHCQYVVSPRVYMMGTNSINCYNITITVTLFVTIVTNDFL
jgi:hypothetical protein